MKTLWLLACLLTALSASAQTVIGVEPIASKMVKPWQVKSFNSYSGAYHFGFSECEAVFNLKIKNGVATASKTYFDMPAMRQIVKKFSRVRIVSNKFYSDQANGEFVSGEFGDGSTHGLKIYNSWSCSTPKGSAEIGVRYK